MNFEKNLKIIFSANNFLKKRGITAKNCEEHLFEVRSKFKKIFKRWKINLVCRCSS